MAVQLLTTQPSALGSLLESHLRWAPGVVHRKCLLSFSWGIASSPFHKHEESCLNTAFKDWEEWLCIACKLLTPWGGGMWAGRKEPGWGQGIHHQGQPASEAWEQFFGALRSHGTCGHMLQTTGGPQHGWRHRAAALTTRLRECGEEQRQAFTLLRKSCSHNLQLCPTGAAPQLQQPVP